MDNSAPISPATVLFVDDDASFLETVQAALAPLSGEQWKLLVSRSASQALEQIRAQIIDLAVLDVHMPGTDGLQLLQSLNRDFPSLPKVLLTSAPDAATRLSGLEAGAMLFLEKPGSLAGMESLFATLNELVKWHRKQDPNRPRRQAGLIEMVRLECASGNSRLIEVQTDDVTGLIYIKTGSILHAEAPGRRGQSAFTFLASHPQAAFYLKEFADPPERSVTRQWEFLVLEAFQLREQLIQAAQEAKRKEGSSPARPAPEPPTSTSRALKEIAAASPGRKPQAPAASGPLEKLRLAPTGPSRKPAPAVVSAADHATAPATARSAHPPPPFALQTPPVALEIGAAATAGSPHIEEVLVCSQQNEVLYEWRCTRVESRFRWLDALRSKSETFSQSLKLGASNRIEFQAHDARVVIRCQNQSTLFIRSNAKLRLRTSNIPPFNRSAGDWLAGHSQIRGLLACGLMRANHTLISCSYTTEFPSDALNPLWRAAHEFAGLASEQNLDAWLIRWIFEQAQLYWVRRLDGRALGLLLTTHPAELDPSRAQTMVLEFSALLEA
jgi:CheY-like chemotaxis protein